eukprot:TRINITY_DN13276_c0_g1_i2.p2 TRINITY_DN13276_c0_g1~~TRINITY_DN13276_c0_g1_i2.p2  ORF type:complete len:240 (-),score=1.49 TRINITY_DN13276_c0_g1_i2:215-934(-)
MEPNIIERQKQDRDELQKQIDSLQREGEEIFGNSELYLAKETIERDWGIQDMVDLTIHQVPPECILRVLEPVYFLVKNSPRAPTWPQIRDMVNEGAMFRYQLVDFEPKNAQEIVWEKIRRNYLSHPEFRSEKWDRQTRAINKIADWVISMEKLAMLWRHFQPKMCQLEECKERVRRLDQELEVSRELERNKEALADPRLQMDKDQSARGGKPQETNTTSISNNIVIMSRGSLVCLYYYV